ncbi:MAG: hypothetical protein WDN31_12845 [Hyphomicrobium sp.]
MTSADEFEAGVQLFGQRLRDARSQARPSGIVVIGGDDDTAIGLDVGKACFKALMTLSMTMRPMLTPRLETTMPPLTFVSSATGRVSPIMDAANVAHSFAR